MKLLLFDLGRTFYPISNPAQQKRSIAAVHQWIAAGNQFAVASARGLHHTPRLKKTRF